MSSSNITSWADASSDSDSESSRIAPPPSGLPGSDSYAAFQAEEDVYGDEGFAANEGGYGRTLEELPDQPPFTAFVGNLNRDMEQKEFRGELEKMLVDRNCVTEEGDVKIVGTRLINDRNTGQSKGFGYVEFGTPQELLAFLNLGHHQISGRKVKVDIASGEPRSRGGGGSSDRRRSGRAGGGRNERNYDRQYSNDSYRSTTRNNDDTPIDGSQFQGGRYLRSASGMSQGSRGSMRGNGSGMIKRSDSAASTGSDAVAAGQGRQRPSLKLAPRTKPLEEGNVGSRSSIFGEAKPRDEKEFEEKKTTVPTEKEEGVKKVTTSMSDLEVVQETSNGTNDDSNDKHDATEVKEEGGIEKNSEASSGQNKSSIRKPSRGAGRGGDRPERSNSDRKRDGRKSGRGEGRGGGRGDKRNSERGGRNNGRESGKRASGKATNGDAAKDGDGAAPVSSLAAAAAMPAKQESKARPKKTNSFAAFMDDSDDE